MLRRRRERQLQGHSCCALRCTGSTDAKRFAIRDSDAVSAKISWRACSQALLVTAKTKRFLVCRYASSALQLKGRRALIDAQDNESERR